MVRQVNRWAVGVGSRHPRLPQFIIADPYRFGDELVHEVEECLRLGARGVKIHPYHCGHVPDIPEMYPTYELCQDRGVPLLADTGGRPNTEPRLWAPVLEKFPRLRLIVAHLPGELWDERLELAERFAGDNLVFDTAGGFVDALHPPYVHRELLAEHAARIIRRVGVDRVLFGSDGFFGDPMDTAKQIVAMPLTDAEKERILCGNAKAFLELA